MQIFLISHLKSVDFYTMGYGFPCDSEILFKNDGIKVIPMVLITFALNIWLVLVNKGLGPRTTRIF
jgi:hypothetical protein